MTDHATSFCCRFPEQTFPVGTRSHWFKNTDDATRPNRLRCTPIVHADWEDPDSSWIDVDLEFEPEDWDTESHGLVYTNPEFEAAVQAWWATTPFAAILPPPVYTEMGMQGAEHVSMETSAPRTGHQRVALLKLFHDVEQGIVTLQGASDDAAQAA